MFYGKMKTYMSLFTNSKKQLWRFLITRTKHIEVSYHFIYELVSEGFLSVHFVNSSNQFADIFIIGLLTPIFSSFWSKLMCTSSPSAWISQDSFPYLLAVYIVYFDFRMWLYCLDSIMFTIFNTWHMSMNITIVPQNISISIRVQKVKDIH